MIDKIYDLNEHLIEALKDSQRANAELRADGFKLLDRGHDASSRLASATDLLNQWARQDCAPEAKDERSLNDLINRLWDAHCGLQMQYRELKARMDGLEK